MKSKLAAAPETSRYFSRPKAAAEGFTSTSRYFASAPSFASASARTLGPFLRTLGDGDPTDPFIRCPIFVRRYGELVSDEEIPKTWRRRRRRRHPSNEAGRDDRTAVGQERVAWISVAALNTIVKRSVQHLCPHGCYLRAFAPAREWHALRRAAQTLSGRAPDRMLRGWRCSLECPADAEAEADNIALPRIVFISRNEDRFPSMNDALRRLGFADVKVKRRSRMTATTKVRLQSQTAKSRRSCKRKRCDLESDQPIPQKADAAVTTATAISPSCGYFLRVKDARIIIPKEAKISQPQLGLQEPSPFGLLEELFISNPWRLLLSTIMLNQTSRQQVDPVLHTFLSTWRNEREASMADPGEMSAVISPLGLQHKRSKAIVRFSREYIDLVDRKSKHAQIEQVDGNGGGGCQSSDEQQPSQKTHHKTADDRCDSNSNAADGHCGFHLTEKEVLSLYWCGDYALSAYQIFIQGKLDVPVIDHALHCYVDYQRAQKI